MSEMLTNPIILELDAISKSFSSPHGLITILNKVSLQLRAGEVVSVCGESGVGKSTLLYIAAALESMNAGTLTWADSFNVNLHTKTQIAHKRGRCIGFVFQSYYLIPELNAFENILMPCRILGILNAETKERAQSLLDRLGLYARRKALPGTLSGGERQRLAIARALIHEPQLIVADEPTGNLDEATAIHVLEMLLKLCAEEHRGLLLVTHNMTFAAQAHRCLMLKNKTLIPKLFN